MLKFAIIVLTFGSTGLLAFQCVPLIVDKIQKIQHRKAEKILGKLDSIFLKARLKRLTLIYTASPIVLGIIGLVLLKNLIGFLIGIAVGSILPAFVVKNLDSQRKEKFHSQLVDGLMLLSSSLKGGLSITQAIEVLVAEMPAPISQEFGIILAENRMGVPIEESFNHLNQRMASPELNLVTTAILLAREAGGNLPKIFSRVVSTIREKTKIAQQVKTLTLQGRIQGIIMSLLPIVFCVVTYTLNPRYFDIMLNSSLGRTLLGYAVLSEVVGIFLIQKISKVNI